RVCDRDSNGRRADGERADTGDDAVSIRRGARDPRVSRDGVGWGTTRDELRVDREAGRRPALGGDDVAGTGEALDPNTAAVVVVRDLVAITVERGGSEVGLLKNSIAPVSEEAGVCVAPRGAVQNRIGPARTLSRT